MTILRELARLAALDLSPSERTLAFLGGAVGGALAFAGMHVVNNRWPKLLDPIRPH